MKQFCHFLSILILLMLGVHPASAQTPIQLGDIVGQSGIVQRSVEVSGGDVRVRQLASRLVDLHGGLERVAQGGDFRFHFEATSPTQVRIGIFSGGQKLWEQAFTGASLAEAIALAGDGAVERTLGIPGIFASQLAFISDRTGHSEVYVSDLLFEKTRQLTQDRSQCLSPNLSPDGSVVLYTSYHRTGFPDIYRIDLATGRRTTFAAFKGTNTGATFSPDGRQVAMILSGSGNAEVFLGNNQGRQLRRLTRSPSLEADPSWAPDGRRLLLTSDQMGRPQIYTIGVTGGSPVRVRTDISRHCSEPVWNPRDADQIAFTAAMAGEFEVATFRFSEGKSSVVTKGAGDAVHPVWLRDGRHLIYTERTSRFSRLMILDTVTGARARLSPSELNNASEASVSYRR
jgi:TolB protein